MYLCPFDVEEGEDEGVPEQQVRLDEVLVDAGDVLLYVYDYGDNWEHTIMLEAIFDRAAGSPYADCVDGGRKCPPEGCGGVHGYEQMLADAADPASEGHAEAVESMVHYVGVTDFDPSLFDRDEVNATLASTLDRAVRAAYRSVKLGGLTAWLLNRVGDDGIKLTAAGYLPPVHVEAAMTELGMYDEWIGKGNRADLTFPVLELREATKQLGLVRKYRGRLLLTKQAQRLRDEPLALWWHIARRLPHHKPD